jgi:glycosyltransferase involved in cell wall biosynthesis
MVVKGLFCHDLPIYKDINGEYCSTTLTDDFFKRYFSVVDELAVATRVYSLDCTYSEAHQERITLHNIKIVEFPNLNKPKYVLSRIPKAKKVLKKEIENSELVFIRGGTIARMASKICRKIGKKYLTEAAGCAWDEYWNYSILGKVIAPYVELEAKIGIWQSGYVIYVTEKWLQSRYPTKGVSTYASNVILQEVDDKALEKRLNRINSRKPDSTWVIGTTGGISNKAKGQQYVIKAIAKLKDKIDIRYELAGTGSNEYLSKVAKKYHVEDRVVFKGELTHMEILDWLDSIDTYIQPSMQEGLPRSLVEAFSRGCPAIGSTTGGIPELLDEDFIFKRGNVDSLVEVMKKFYKYDWASCAERNHKKAKEYVIDNLNERREKIYKEYRDAVIRKG